MRKYLSIFITLLIVLISGWALSFDLVAIAQDAPYVKSNKETTIKTVDTAKSSKKIDNKDSKTTKTSESNTKGDDIENINKQNTQDKTTEENPPKTALEELKEVENKKAYELMDTSRIEVEQIVSDKEKLIKVPVNIDENTPIFLGGHDQFETVQRALKVQNRVYSTVLREKLEDKADITVNITPIDDYYQVKINDKDVFKLRDQDFQVNNVEKEELIKRVKHSIQGIIASINKASDKDIQEFLSQPVDFINFFIYFTLIVIFLEFLLVIINKYKKKFIIAQLKRYCIRRNKKLNYIETHSRDELPIEYEQKIELIANQVNLCFNFLLRSTQVVLIFFALLKLLYFYPATYDYANQAVIFIQSIIVIFKESMHEWFGTEEARGKLGAVLTIFIVSGFLVYVTKLTGSLLGNLLLVLSDLRKRKHRRLITVIQMISINIQMLLVLVAIVIALHELGFEVTTILAGAGIAGIALSFGAQNLIKDMINGIFIIIEDQYGINDTIKVNGITGKVEDMNLRITVLRDFYSGNINIIPNGEINAVTVYTKGWANANLDISIAYKEDVDTAIRLIKETSYELRKDFPAKIIGEPKVLGLNNLNDSSVDIKLVMKTLAGEQWGIEREFRRRIKYVFDKNNIEIPFPHRTVYLQQASPEQENINPENSEAEENNQNS